MYVSAKVAQSMREELVKVSGVRDVVVSLSPTARSIGEDTKQDPEALEKAKDLRKAIGSRYNISPYLSGSMATGLNLPGSYDYDYGVRVTSKPKFEKLVNRLEKSKDFKASPFNKKGTDYHVFTGKLGGEEVDLALLYGDKGSIARSAIREAQKRVAEMDPGEKKEILQTKALLKDLSKVPVVKDIKWKGKSAVKHFVERPWKRDLDKKIGLVRLGKDALPGEEKLAELADAQRKRLMRSNVFGHRTNNLTPILESQKLLSAADVGKKGLLKDVETNNPFSRGRGEAKGEKKLRAEVFITKGLMPPNATYGKYGVLFEKRKADPSRYLNFVPEEHVAARVARSKMTFVVPDQELKKWQKKHPDRVIIAESDVPKEKILPERSYKVLAERVFRGPTFFQKTEKIRLK